MRRLHFRLLLVTGLCIVWGSCRPAAIPVVTARGATGAEDTASVSIPNVTLKPGETLLVTTNDEAKDAAVTWNGVAMHEDITAHGSNSGCYTKIFSLYSAGGGTGEIMASHVSAGDLSMNAYTVTNLAPSALDKIKAGDGSGTNPASGATATTTKANELLWGVIGYGSNSTASGTWSDGFTPGGQSSYSGDTGAIEEGYKVVSSTGAYSAAKTGTKKDGWNAVIVTYAIAQ